MIALAKMGIVGLVIAEEQHIVGLECVSVALLMLPLNRIKGQRKFSSILNIHVLNSLSCVLL